MNSVGTQIKNIREFKNLTQTYVAKKIGMSQSKLARIENGKIQITDELLSLISGVLETDNQAIKHFDENVQDGLNNKIEPIIQPQMMAQYFKILREIHQEEIKMLEKKITLLKSLYIK